MRANRSGAVAVILLLTALSGRAYGQQPEALEVARRMAHAGAIDLALERVDQSQPRDASAQLWADWELLRLELLSRRGRDGDVLKRVAQIRQIAFPDRVAMQFWLAAARAALRQSQFALARDYYARYFLSAELGANDYRAARLGVIDSYTEAGNADDAYRSMLRFQQDFAPLRGDEAERFAAALIRLGRAQDAANWLSQLDKSSAAAATLRLRAKLISADSAIAHARALLAKGGGDAALALLMEGAAAQNNRALEIEVRELRLNMSDASVGPPEAVAMLWKQYVELGAQSANQLQLLSGDDQAWIGRAERLSATQPQLGRALLGHVVANSRDADVRTRAQLQIVNTLRNAKLPLTALRLFTDANLFPLTHLDDRVRFQLGMVAVESKRPADALRFWQNLAVPTGLTAQEWQVRYLSVLFQAGMVDAGLESAKVLLTTQTALPPELVTRLIALATDTLEAWQIGPAQTLFTMLLPHAQGANRMAALLGLGRAREMLGQHRLAAEAYLNAAALSAAPDSEREALRAREFGAFNLAKAGFLDDARASYQWLAANAKDSATRDRAAQALKRF